jgi:hypothetical protein
LFRHACTALSIHSASLLYNVVKMRHLASYGLQSAASGRQWLAPHTLGASSSSSSSLRMQHSRFRTAAAPSDAAALIDLIQWPEGTRPKRGGITKASLTRLKVRMAASPHDVSALFAAADTVEHSQQSSMASNPNHLTLAAAQPKASSDMHSHLSA